MSRLPLPAFAAVALGAAIVLAPVAAHAASVPAAPASASAPAPGAPAGVVDTQIKFDDFVYLKLTSPRGSSLKVSIYDDGALVGSGYTTGDAAAAFELDSQGKETETYTVRSVAAGGIAATQDLTVDFSGVELAKPRLVGPPEQDLSPRLTFTAIPGAKVTLWVNGSQAVSKQAGADGLVAFSATLKPHTENRLVAQQFAGQSKSGVHSFGITQQ